MCCAKRTHPCGQPVMARLILTMASMVSALDCMLAHVQEQDCYVRHSTNTNYLA